MPGSPDVALDWRTDHLLGAPFQEAPLGPATLVRYPHPPDAPAPRVAVVHVHGYNDYFFQEHLARAFAAAGYAFYAVDLRAAGRSLRPGQLPHFVMDLREQATDIAAASRTVRGLEPGLPLVVHAHSTGGLTAALWAHAHRNAAGADAGPDLLVLDSPFLDLRAPQWKRTVGTRFLDTVGHLAATAIVNDGPSRYAEHLLAANGGRWQFDTTLKRPEGVPSRVGWFVAVRRGQARVAAGLEIACPVLLARSDTSGPDTLDNPLLDAQDTVLDVEQMAALVPCLGADVTELVVPGGVHDLTLSARGPREAYLHGMLQWADSRLTDT
ncbi:alpha/beta hydrolase [Promicromonospora thailandica]|uniref:Lysophospholipase, alpha-beta hydrolase superfamily n=1 Tax=Promicromonospora thailandica TaxID=765201 RepID=A0A9X2JWS8_9MICO|nr:alpha/beta fold hydrolase [Promicromonospora thailandica]MCP2265473.1 Lysophospholipase, alpha-beta hydrolase superfamily [Promicromonospora thailandica]